MVGVVGHEEEVMEEPDHTGKKGHCGDFAFTLKRMKSLRRF